MAVALILKSGGTTSVQAWNRFVSHAQAEAVQSRRLLAQILTERLHMYGAWTNWDDADDPIWFADEEALTQFLLTWS